MQPPKPSDAAANKLRAGVLIYRRGNGFEFLMLQRRCDGAWEPPAGPVEDARQHDVRLAALRNAHLSSGVWPDCYQLHRDFHRVNFHLENGCAVQDSFYLAEIDRKTRSGDAIDSDTLPKPSTDHAAFQWMSGDLAKVRIKTEHGRTLLGQATEFLESEDQLSNMFNVLSSIK